MRDESFADPVRRALPSLNLVHDKPQAKGLEERGLVREEPVHQEIVETLVFPARSDHVVDP